MKKNDKNLILIDGNSFCYRAYYAVRPLSNSKGQPTNAVYGFISMLNRVITEQGPSHIAVAFDLKGPTFRHKKYENYKIHRKPMPDDLVSQMPYIKELVRAMNIAVYEAEGYEADDVIATLSKNAEKERVNTLIVTADKDALQLVSDYIKIYDPKKDGGIIGKNEVKKRFGIEPACITDMMALMGDASDNIPGIKGIGEKGAVAIMKEFGSLENLVKNVDKIKNEKKRKMITDGIKMAELSKELATVKEDVPIDVELGKMQLRPPDNKKLVALYKELEFKSLLNTMDVESNIKSKYVLVKTKSELSALIDELLNVKEMVFDFETTHYDPMLASPVGVSFSGKKGVAHYVPLNGISGMDPESILKMLKSVFENEKIKKIGQNIKYDSIILKRNGVCVKNIYFDTMIASYVLNPSKMNHNLSDIAMEYLQHKMIPIEALIGKGKNAITMDKVDIDKIMEYCCEDSDITFRLKEILLKKIKENGFDDLFYKMEMPLCGVLSEMEMNGVAINTKYLKMLSSEMEKKLKSLECEIFESAGKTFNINSPKQLQTVLFEELKLPITKRTKTGASTDESVLNNLAEKHDFPKKILIFRAFSKLKSTYVDALPKLVNPVTKKVHTSFNQTVTQTGRLSSSSPNLQNIPIKTEEGRKVRKAFVPSDNAVCLLSADYSQIELRILAHLSNDEILVKAFKENKDIHAYTASLIFDKPEKEIDFEMRGVAKTVNFGIVYGMGPYKLSRELHIDLETAKKFIENYFKRYMGVNAYLENCLKQARKDKYVKTIFSRRRYIPEINNDNIRIKSFAERTAINAPIQGSAADIIKIAMLKIHEKLEDYKSKMILQVHDELVFDTYPGEEDRLAKMVKAEMEGVISLQVPLVVNVKKGKNWLEMDRLNA